ncbi:c-type cytochrome [Cellulophaga sp. Hel_I_12]|uniref:c-type cytochrome n=1 Tax=Cellulophaga sp. Hel_I_12 TaxID=1249972 RepID=UPI0006489EAB|nr:c-type cytochrome [Cellulophaga sp. Hel_I_12]
MRILALFLLCLWLQSCNTNQKSETKDSETTLVRGELSMDSQIFLGNRLFSEKTCITCHDAQKSTIGPSVKEIMKVYKKENGNIVAFLKGEAEPIVEASAAQIAMMQVNIKGFLKNISDEELGAIATYMLHVDELNK